MISKPKVETDSFDFQKARQGPRSFQLCGERRQKRLGQGRETSRQKTQAIADDEELSLFVTRPYIEVSIAFCISVGACPNGDKGADVWLSLHVEGNTKRVHFTVGSAEIGRGRDRVVSAVVSRSELTRHCGANYCISGGTIWLNIAAKTHFIVIYFCIYLRKNLVEVHIRKHASWYLNECGM